MNGILGQLPPGLAGWVAADQMNRQKQAGQMRELQGVLGMQGALMQQQQAAQMGPLKMQLLKAQIAKAGRPDTPFGKIDPSKFTPESIAKFVASGGADFSVLDPLRKKDMTAAGEVVDLYNTAPGTKFNVTTPHQLWQQNTQFPTQTGIDLARLNQPVLSEAAGGWVPRPQVSIPGLLGGAPVAPRQPQGPMPSSMDGSPIQPLGGFITPPHPDENAPRMSPMQIPPAVQAQRDAEAARIRTAELQPNGGGMLPTSNVIPVPGLAKKPRKQYDPERGMMVNLDTGVASPVTSAGEPLGRKPEKPTAESLKQTTGVANLRTAISTYKDALQGFGALDILSPAARAKIGTAYNNMLLQAKEAYNLGVLNGPDYMILQEVITNPTSTTGAITPKTALNDQLAQLDRIMSGVGETVQAVQADRGRGTYNAPKAPTVGAVVDGYRFKGGDPAKRESWVKQ
jgi:hypothetical protein